MSGGDLIAGRGDARCVVQPLKFTDLAAFHQRDDHAGLPGPGRAARAVQVVLMVVRRVELDHQVERRPRGCPGPRRRWRPGHGDARR